MSDENRDLDKILKILPEKGTTKVPRVIQKHGISLDVIKSKYIADGMTAEEISKELFLPLEKIQDIINSNNLPELRKAYIVQGVQKIQNTQLQQSHKLMDLENNFKKMRIIQLEKVLEDHLAYYSRHGDFYKRHPISGEILKNSDGIPMQVKLPNVSKELLQLKEAVTMSEGVRQMLNRLDEIINTRKPEERADNVVTVDVTEYEALFEKKEKK